MDIEQELWARDQQNTPFEERAAHELKRRREEIERLRADNARLMAALLEIADLKYECGDSECGAEHIAREALESLDS